MAGLFNTPTPASIRARLFQGRGSTPQQRLGHTLGAIAGRGLFGPGQDEQEALDFKKIESRVAEQAKINNISIQDNPSEYLTMFAKELHGAGMSSEALKAITAARQLEAGDQSVSASRTSEALNKERLRRAKLDSVDSGVVAGTPRKLTNDDLLDTENFLSGKFDRYEVTSGDAPFSIDDLTSSQKVDLVAFVADQAATLQAEASRVKGGKPMSSREAHERAWKDVQTYLTFEPGVWNDTVTFDAEAASKALLGLSRTGTTDTEVVDLDEL